MRIVSLLFLVLFYVNAYAGEPVIKFNLDLVRPWSSGLGKESHTDKPFIAIHKLKDIELFYLAAHHDVNPKSQTLRLVNKLFDDFSFDVLIIESIPNSFGESPRWFLEEATKGQNADIISGGESALAVIRADEKKIRFFGGEISHDEIFKRLRAEDYTETDILGFYLARQIPQWVRQKEEKKELIERKGPPFLNHYCKKFGIEKTCPTLLSVKNWYKKKMGAELSVDISNEDVAPKIDGPLYTHKISSSVGAIRDRYTLGLLEIYLNKYRRVAIIYGGSHYITLKKSLEASMGFPKIVALKN